MLGALIGDIVGSRFEFNNIKTKDFELFNEESSFTDDTVMTLAVLDWAKNRKDDSLEEASRFLQKWGRKYPNAGYGGHFVYWLFESNPKPYNSCGNGSAMRISPIGFLYNTEKEVIENAKIITSCTHNHPEGLKGAYVTAISILMARKGATKEEIKEYVSKYYDLSFDYETLRKTYTHEEEICQNTVPEAIYCFLISNSFEDCLRTTISIGGDCDTTAAIFCAIAEAYYIEIPEYIKEEALKRLTPEMKEILKEYI